MEIVKRRQFLDVDLATRGLWSVCLDSSQAGKWLELNVRNRRIRRTLVNYLKRQIATGEWQDDHPQPIVFSVVPRLIDGQHRLLAIAQSCLTEGHGVRVRVETGANDGIREYLDSGIPRSLDDRVELHKDPKINKLAAQLVAVDLVVHQSNLTGRYGKATPDDAKEFYTKHEEAIMFVAERHKRHRGVGMMAVTLAAMEYREKDADLAAEFYTDLFVPAGRCQQAQMLRDFLLKTTNSGGPIIRREAYQKAVACMKAHQAGREVRKVLRCASW